MNRLAKSLIIPIASFRIFSKIRGDIRIGRCTTSIVDTVGKWKSLNQKSVKYFAWILLGSRVHI
jgi:hypothetical protein